MTTALTHYTTRKQS